MVQGTPQDVRPRFRQDLVAEPIDEQGGRFIDVIDPDSGNGFRFYEVEYSLACAMDGERDVEGIVRWATEELGVTPSTSEVQTVIATLGELGYLEGGAAGVAAAATAATAASDVAPRAARPTPSVELADDELAHGIVVGKPDAATAGGDFELGHVGQRPAAHDELPEAADLDLGAPGRVDAPRARELVDDIPLGMAGASTTAREVAPAAQVEDMSLDLSDHIAVRPDDVKEAVRQSRVMSAVEVPKDLLDQLDAPVPGKIAAAAAAADKLPAPATTKQGAGPAVPGPAPVPPPIGVKSPAAVAKAEAKAAKPAVDLPKTVKPAAADAAKSGTTAQKPRTSPALIAIAIVVVIAAGGYAVWKYVLANDDAGDDTSDSVDAPRHAHKPTGSNAPKAIDPTSAGTPTTPTTPPPPPAPPTAKLATEQLPGQDVKAAGPGVVESIVATDTVVKAGDVVGKLVGGKPIEAAIAALAPDIDKRLPAEITAAEQALATATTGGNKTAIAAAQARLDDRHKSLEGKQAAVAAKQAELAKFQATAPVDGKVTAVAKAGAKITGDDVLATIGAGPVLTATFDVPSPAIDAYKVAAPVTIALGDKKLACAVASADGGKLKVSCPADASIADGSAATLVAPAATPPAP